MTDITQPAVRLCLWVCRILAAAILVQTLFFKFTGAEESIYIFSTLGAEPWGRIGSGFVELLASVLILVPKTTALGALLALGTMAGAILSHLTILGTEIRGDGGLLFSLAVIVAFLSAVLLWAYHRDLPVIGPWFGELEASRHGR